MKLNNDEKTVKIEIGHVLVSSVKELVKLKYHNIIKKELKIEIGHIVVSSVKTNRQINGMKKTS